METKIQSYSSIAIVGGGPVGLYTALILGQSGIEVFVFERSTGILRHPKAAGYFPVVLDDFKQTGIYDDVYDAGLKSTGLSWRKPKGDLLARIDFPPPAVGIQLEQYDFAEILLKHLSKFPNVTIVFGATLVHIENSADLVIGTFKCAHDEGLYKHECKYMVGADGGKSTVRKMMGIGFEGFTWSDHTIITVKAVYSSHHMAPFEAANFIVDPELWGVVIKLGNDNWRITFPVRNIGGISEDWTEEKMVRRAREVFHKLLKGPLEELRITAIASYKMHQLCATRFVEGNVILAGDAAHLTNPMGGLGLTTGLLDAALLGRILRRVLLQGQSSSQLHNYAEERRSAFLAHTNPMAIANLERLMGSNESAVKDRDELFGQLNTENTDCIRKFGEAQLKLSSTLGAPL